MPRVTLASVSQIESFLDKITLLVAEGYISEVNITTAEQMLRDFEGFSDKAFKAFYARKILQIPPVIAAQVFYVSNGLISQAAGDLNVYTVRNQEGMDDDLARGFFMLPNAPGRHGIGLTRAARTNIFINLVKLAIIKNRGVDIPRFQNRMVAGYMSEESANALRDGILPRFARNIAASPQMGASQTSATPEATSGETRIGLPYRRNNTTERTQLQINSSIADLIAAGADRDQARRLMTELSDLGFNLTFTMRDGSELRYRMFYFGSMADAVPSGDALALIVANLNLNATDVTMGERNGDLIGNITLSRQAQSTEATSTSTTRRTIFTDPILALRTNNWFRNNGYEDTYEAFYDLVSATPGAMITVDEESPARLRIIVELMGMGDYTGIPAREMKAALAGPRDMPSQRMRYRQIDYTLNGMRTRATWTILPFESSATSTTSEAAETAPSEPDITFDVTRLNQRQRRVLDLDVRPQRALEKLERFAEMGYDQSAVQKVLNFLADYRLEIFKIERNTEGGREVTDTNRRSYTTTPFSIMQVQDQQLDNPQSRFRTARWVNFLRQNLVAGLFPGTRSNNNQGRQRVTFRRRGQGSIGFLHLPNLRRVEEINRGVTSRETQTAASASQTTSEPMTSTGGVNRQLVYLGNVQGPANRIYRAGGLRFDPNGRFGHANFPTYSAIAFFYDPSQGSMPGSILTAPLGTIERDAGRSFTDVMNYLADNNRLENPGKLKAYFVRDNAQQVAKGIVEGLPNDGFTPVRPTGGATEITVDRVQVYQVSEFARWASTEPMLSILRGIGNLSSTIPSSSTVTEEQAAQVSQMSFTNTLGFEFEGGGSQGRRETATALSRMGVPCNFEGYNHTTRAQWKIVTDATLGGVQNGMELVSPILTGEEGLKNLAKCLRASQEAGMFIHEQGGVHIHMGNQQWDLQHRKNILLNQVKVQKFFLKTIPQYLENQARQWARPFDTSSSFTDRVRNANSTQQLARVTGTRYMLINITNTRQPTWEWRYPTGSLEVDTNTYSARMIDKLVQVSKFGELPSDMASGEGLKKWMSQDIYNFWKNRIYELSQTKGSTRRPSSN